MVDNRLQLLQKWLDTVLNASFTIQPASSDASFRRYFRVQQADKSYIAMDAPPEHEDIKPFIDIAERIFRAKVNAPQIFSKNIDDGFLLLSDLGHQDYLSNLNADSVDNLYNDAFNALLTMQKNIAAKDLPLYDADLLQNEMNLFADWFIQKHLQTGLSSQQQHIFQQTQQLLIDNALAQPQVFVHRDYHSRNLMLTSNNNPGVIDFQDAVIGPITYDLVSLLRDCYISWPDNKVYQWVEQFHQAAQIDIDIDTFIRWFDLMGLQRHIKVLGIFSRLYYRDGKNGYLKDLPLTFRYTKMITSKYAELADFDTLLNQLDIEKNLPELTQ